MTLPNPIQVDPQPLPKYLDVHNPEDPEHLLRVQGYEILGELGEGKTRKVYKVRYTDNGGVDQIRVAKVPITMPCEDSICTQINVAKEQTNRREVTTSNQIQHDNISRTIQTIVSPKGKIINIEDFHEGLQCLEQRLRSGPLTRSEFRSYFAQVLDAVNYLNHEKRILHRDIKPSNILVPMKGERAKTILTDLENSKLISHIEAQFQPTRGGTAYTHPELLESLVNENLAHASPRSEVYALGVTMYHALTGEIPFEYTVREDKDGNSVGIAGEQKTIALFDGQELLKDNKVPKKQHQRQLKKGLKKLPKMYRGMIHKALSLDSDAYLTVSEMQRDFNKLTNSWIKKTASKVAVPIGAAALTALSFLGGVQYNETNNKKIEVPQAIVDTPKEDPIKRFDFTLDGNSTHSSERELRKYVFLDVATDLDERLPRFLDKISFSNHAGDRNYADVIAGYAQSFAREVDGAARQKQVDPKLTAALLIGGYLADEEKMREEFGEMRYSPSFVPRSFDPVMYYMDNWMRLHDESVEIWKGSEYLFNILETGKDIEEVMATYYFERELIDDAKQRSNSEALLPRLREDGVFEPGYAQVLKQRFPERTDAVLRTLAAYNVIEIRGHDGDAVVAYKRLGSKHYDELDYMRKIAKVESNKFNEWLQIDYKLQTDSNK